jgi:hypothetical protein
VTFPGLSINVTKELNKNSQHLKKWSLKTKRFVEMNTFWFQYSSYKMVQARHGMAIQFLVRFPNGDKKLEAQNGLVLGWLVLAEIDQWKTGLIRFSDVYCSSFLSSIAQKL